MILVKGTHKQSRRREVIDWADDRPTAEAYAAEYRTIFRNWKIEVVQPKPAGRRPRVGLTALEQQVIELWHAGKINRDIARQFQTTKSKIDQLIYRLSNLGVLPKRSRGVIKGTRQEGSLEKEQKLIELRNRNLSYDQIAQALGWKNGQIVRNAVSKLIRQGIIEPRKSGPK